MADYNLPIEKQGKYIIVDTTIKSTDVMFIDEMSGDKGDAGRKVYLAIKERARSNDPKDPLIPTDLTGRDVRFQGHDAKGKYKRISLSTKIENAKAGLVEITLPREIYQAPGAYQNGEFEIFVKNSGTKVSTVPVGLEVYDNLAHMSVGESAHYIDEAEKLIKDLESLTGRSLDEFRANINKMNGSVDSALSSIKSLENLVKTWQQLVKDNGVAEIAGNNIYTGINIYEKPVTGFMSGTVIQYFNGNNPQQDLDDPQVLRDMRSGTTQTTYYGGNKVKNNPISTDYVVVTRHKISGASVYEQLMFFGQESGVIKSRVVNDVQGAARFGTWGTVAEWGAKWQPLAPYLSDDFIAHSSAPSFRVIGNKVEFSGAITAKKTITNTNNVSLKITKPLPFNFIRGQEKMKVSGGMAIYALFAYGNQLEMQKHQRGGNVTDIVAGNYIGISGTFDIQ